MADEMVAGDSLTEEYCRNPDDGMMEDCSPMQEKFHSLPKPRRSEISHERRLELYSLAKKIAKDVLKNTGRHERCLLRQMVENLMPGYN